MSFAVDITCPLGLHLPKPTDSVVPVVPLCLAEVMARITLTKSGRLRVSIDRHVILDTFTSEPSGELYETSRAFKKLDKMFGRPRLGAGLTIKTKKDNTNE